MFIFILSAEARKRHGDDKIKIYQSKFVNMYYAISEHKPKTAMKLVCLLPEEKVNFLIEIHCSSRLR